MAWNGGVKKQGRPSFFETEPKAPEAPKFGIVMNAESASGDPEMPDGTVYFLGKRGGDVFMARYKADHSGFVVSRVCPYTNCTQGEVEFKPGPQWQASPAAPGAPAAPSMTYFGPLGASLQMSADGAHALLMPIKAARQ